MIAAERHQNILELVAERGQITITEICELFDVSEMTARRDLNKLDQEGVLRRVHGGAVRNLGRSYEPPFTVREIKNQEIKKNIGLKAAELIFDGDSIALDVGTTTLEIVTGLKGKHDLTIVTSCLQIANAITTSLSLESDIRLIIAGGIVRPRELSMVGSIPEKVYSELHVDKAFIGIGGISLEDGLTEFNMEDARVKQILMESAREVIVVADSSKFGDTTFTTVSPLTSVDKIVTDRSIDQQYLSEIEKLGVEVILA